MKTIRVKKDGPEVSLRLETGKMVKLRPGDEVEISDGQAARLLGMSGSAFEPAEIPAKVETAAPVPAKAGKKAKGGKA